MLLSHSKQFLFVHIAKTGGTSIREALSPYRWGHRYAAAQFTNAKAHQQHFETLINEQIIPIDSEINKLTNRIETNQQTLADANIKQGKAQENHQAYSDELEGKKRTLDELTTYLNVHAANGKMAGEISGWKEKAARFSDDESNLAETTKKITATQQLKDGAVADLAEKQHAKTNVVALHQQSADNVSLCESSLNQLLSNGDTASVNADIAVLNNNWPVLASCEQWQRLYINHKSSHAEKSERLTSLLSDIESLKQERAELAASYKATQSHLKDVESLIKLDAELAHLRQTLSQGEACPLCGATEHDASLMNIDVPETIAKRDGLTRSLENIEKLGTQKREQIHTAEFEKQQCEKVIAEALAAFSQLEADWQGAMFSLNASVVISDVESFNQLQLSCKARQSRLNAQLSDIR